MTRDRPDAPCFIIVRIDGKLVADPVVGTRIIVPGMNGEPPHNLVVTWPQGYTGERAGGEVAVRDRNGRVRAVTGMDVKFVGAGPRPA